MNVYFSVNSQLFKVVSIFQTEQTGSPLNKYKLKAVYEDRLFCLPAIHRKEHTKYMYPDAVIFDFDGVIVDTEPIHYNAFQNVLEPLGLRYTWQEYIEHYMGFDDRDAFREAFKSVDKPLENDFLNILINRKATLFEQISLSAPPYPGVIELLKELLKKGIPLAISSGALRSDIMPILIHLNIRDCFTHIVAADDVPQSKPHPASYLMAKQLLCSSFTSKLSLMSQIYAIEDTPAGILSAKGAGLKVIAVTNSYPVGMLQQADTIVDNLANLIENRWP